VINRAKLNAIIMLHCRMNANLLLNYKYIDMHRVEFLVFYIINKNIRFKK